MAKWKSYEMVCGECGWSDSPIFDMDSEEDTKQLEDGIDCKGCGAELAAKKTLSCHISTPKTSASFLDGIKRPEFTKMKEQRKLERALKAAKKSGDKEVFTDVAKESVGKNLTIKGLPPLRKD